MQRVYTDVSFFLNIFKEMVCNGNVIVGSGNMITSKCVQIIDGIVLVMVILYTE